MGLFSKSEKSGSGRSFLGSRKDKDRRTLVDDRERKKNEIQKTTRESDAMAWLYYILAGIREKNSK